MFILLPSLLLLQLFLRGRPHHSTPPQLLQLSPRVGIIVYKPVVGSTIIIIHFNSSYSALILGWKRNEVSSLEVTNTSRLFAKMQGSRNDLAVVLTENAGTEIFVTFQNLWPILEIEKGSNRSYSVEKRLWKRLWICLKAHNIMNVHMTVECNIYVIRCMIYVICM